ncbi:phenylacetic acid degradation protein PaaN [Stappia sp. BW2]|uniref:phenylacetic acid degradation protein PaaN n=1 Tax=Stappia sp. BW2 TaxID=2592622 RepID=UPI0011DE93A5|nr:phenylacetic acid degradation protein PaaN [Stappia sp. BW2]TYC63010.1 phenylacetic acid degradation protein PaaN [Stappia sp. BW2]
MTDFFTHHRALLDDALTALTTRKFWTPFPEIPSGKLYGETARGDGESAWQALLGKPFDLPDHPGIGRVGAEVSPWGLDLGITYPAADPDTLIAAAEGAASAFAEAGVERRVGALLEALVRLNRMSFLLGHATMHTTGQAFAMAFQAGGPHAQDRGLEAVAVAYAELTRYARDAVWEKPQGKHAPLVIEKHWTLVPRGPALTIGCNTFPTWNGYPGLFASLATGNPVIVKPHPRAILPLALTVRVLREVLAEAGLPADAVVLAADAPGEEITKTLVADDRIAMIDYTGSTAFADWIRANTSALVFTEEAGVNSVTITGTDDFDGMCANLAFSLSLYSGQMCTSPQNLYVPKDGIETDAGHKSFDAVAEGIKAAIDALLSDPDRAAGVCGTIVNPDTLKRVEAARGAGRVLRDSAETGKGRSATPLMCLAEGESGPQDDECFGPVSFVVPCDSAEDAIARAANIARRKGAITAALYATDEALIDRAARAFAQAGVNLSVNLTGNIYVNQSAAFSDFHVTGANPAGNASLTDTAFVAPRFRRVMIRRPKTA